MTARAPPAPRSNAPTPYKVAGALLYTSQVNARMQSGGDLMDLLSELPLWGQWTVFGLSVALNIWNYLQHLRGETVPRKQADQIQKTADSWQQAWETSMQVQASMTLVLEKMMTVAETMEHLLVSLPQPEKKQGDDS